MNNTISTQTIVLGGGCFWCLEPVFAELRGVKSATVGYAGGKLPNPTYDQVCSGATGHAEVVQVEFNPQEISLAELLEVFFSVHDPTTLNRQGADSGTQYRSIILYADEAQRQTAREVIDQINASKVWGRPLVTQLEPLTVFYPAEDYHQAYFQKNPWAGYCQVVIRPKVAKFRSTYAERLKKN
jgi:methionine-S-sulfoxide reductase